MSKLEDLILAVEVRSLRWLLILIGAILMVLAGINVALNVYRLFVLDTQVQTLGDELKIVRHRLDVERKEHGEPL